MTTCVRCGRERPIKSRRRGLCGPCISSLSNRSEVETFPPLLPPLSPPPAPKFAGGRLSSAWHHAILAALAAGYSQKQIARSFGLGTATVFRHGAGEYVYGEEQLR